ncbi:amino acid/polyamine/organocation transporter, APC superfamily [Chitinophaga costaii]|uniref:Amino acid/polyamine/organocation transporter, APC superfamily n=1 Tax=Chitinophaga costaii TaxID=1335309 RepID=A0A1C4FZI2_9BACT|nr:amino acid permease [Chitinophaga costaii]PUZ20949.1 amino acid permease [Chitinophaga costaii]SCC61264.1 amino acid/polyamine/organocation transporter, APC superfamily [Chitinophaga costaii]
MSQEQLTRRITLLQATAINTTDMVGIGPFVVLSEVAATMHGPWFLYAWLAGALLSFMDAMIWSELGATFPAAGGSYNFLKAGFGEKGGKLMSFLFTWQTLIMAPLVIASAAIGFSQYVQFLLPLTSFTQKLVSGGVVITIIILLYRKIETIGKISVALWIGVLGTMAWIIGSGVVHGHFLEPVRHINDGLQVNAAFATALGFASVKTVYSYLGYYNVCHLGGEIQKPEINIPRSMFISITVIAVLYLCMNISVASVLPLAQIEKSKFVVSEFTEKLSGHTAAAIVTVLILWVAFASVFSATLGYSRVPYAAAKDGAFFRIFARLHPTKHFPYVSLLFLGALAFIFSLTFKLEEVITAIIAMRILVQFIAQGIGLLLLGKRKGRSFFKWHMPFYPVPIIVAIIIWAGIFYSTGVKFMIAGLTAIALGLVVYFFKNFVQRQQAQRASTL